MRHDLAKMKQRQKTLAAKVAERRPDAENPRFNRWNASSRMTKPV